MRWSAGSYREHSGASKPSVKGQGTLPKRNIISAETRRAIKVGQVTVAVPVKVKVKGMEPMAQEDAAAFGKTP